MEADLFIQNGLLIPGWELEMTASRSGGAGGQHVNKTSSRVTLRWNMTQSTALSDLDRERLAFKLGPRITLDGDLLVNVDTERSQFRNRQIARERLAEIIREGLKRPKARHKTKPSKAAKKRRLEGKKARKDTKQLRRRPRIES